MEITIREARQEDVGAIATVLRELGWSGYNDDEPSARTEDRIARLLAQCSDDMCHTVLVAEKAHGDVVGYIAVHWFPNLMRESKDGYISELFVHPANAGKGVGSCLLDEIKTHAIGRGCTRLMLVNRRHRESYRRGFYAQRGWMEQPEAAFFTLTLPDGQQRSA